MTTTFAEDDRLKRMHPSTPIFTPNPKSRFMDYPSAEF
jgi:hypothetical protein